MHIQEILFLLLLFKNDLCIYHIMTEIFIIVSQSLWFHQCWIYKYWKRKQVGIFFLNQIYIYIQWVITNNSLIHWVVYSFLQCKQILDTVSYQAFLQKRICKHKRSIYFLSFCFLEITHNLGMNCIAPLSLSLFILRFQPLLRFILMFSVLNLSLISPCICILKKACFMYVC